MSPRYLMSKIIINVFAVIFLDNFYLITGVWLILLATLASRRFFHFDYPYAIAISSWVFLVTTAVVIAAILAIDFFSHPKGLDRLTLVPYILGASPLFACAILALLCVPKK